MTDAVNGDAPAPADEPVEFKVGYAVVKNAAGVHAILRDFNGQQQIVFNGDGTLGPLSVEIITAVLAFHGAETELFQRLSKQAQNGDTWAVIPIGPSPTRQ